MTNKMINLAVGVSFLLFVGCATQETGTQESSASAPGDSALVEYEARAPVDRVDARGDDIQAASLTSDSPFEVQRDLAEEYRIGPQDLLEISVFGVAELSGAVRVNSRGDISLPLIGQIKAAGLTNQELEDQIEAELGKDYLQDPEVSVYVKEHTSEQVTVEGAINRPGIYELRGPTTLLQTIALANGLANLADASDIKIFRQELDGEKIAQSFDLDKIRSGETEDPQVMANDVIVVQQSQSRVFLRDSLFRDVTDLLNPFKALP